MVKQCILQAARLEFAERGFYKTVVSDIADRAGLGKGTIYRHFGNKEKLFQAVVLEGIWDLQAQIQVVVESSSSPEQAMESILDVHFDFYEHSREFIEILTIEGLQVAGNVQGELMKEADSILTLFRRLFVKGAELGDFRPLDPDKLAVLYLGTIWSILRICTMYNDNEARKNFGKLMLDVFLQGIKAADHSALLSQQAHVSR
jgi:AcrR family transcriptional regulator